MTTLDSVVLEVADKAAAERFLSAALGLAEQVRVRESGAEASGFRGFTLSLTVGQPSTVTSLFESAVGAGATVIKPVTKSFWGYGGTLQAPDGTIWKIATSEKKDTGPATRAIDSVVLLLGCTDVAVSKKFYVEHGLTVAKSFGRKYVEFDSTGPVKLALYGRKALAKDAGVPADGSGSHRIALSADGGNFTDPDGFRWEPVSSSIDGDLASR
ncbi:glyoxalase [Kribbella solani]|uniref:Putative glyoxalase superfamily protein PhnB n=1 Tax=Kribbella solani TaxID=236067 RepID=A0A841DQK1_9ACTN|nr:glyoxalase [Kribbella solani]MBB5980852.1 putative glyoxalase superfamily protein PhnB [Kribbella solani]